MFNHKINVWASFTGKFNHNIRFLSILFLGSFPALAQNPSPVSPPANGQGNKQTKVVLITGNRFCYPLVQKWIDDYYKVHPQVQVIIESRGTTDPAQYDILVEVYDQDEE